MVLTIAHGISIGMATNKEDREKAIDDLELTMSAEESREQRTKATVELMSLFKRGYSV